MANKKKTSFTLSETALELLKEIADRKGLSQASTLEVLIREESKKKDS